MTPTGEGGRGAVYQKIPRIGFSIFPGDSTGGGRRAVYEGPCGGTSWKQIRDIGRDAGAHQAGSCTDFLRQEQPVRPSGEGDAGETEEVSSPLEAHGSGRGSLHCPAVMKALYLFAVRICKAVVTGVRLWYGYSDMM